MTAEEENNDLITGHEFFFETPLYEEIERSKFESGFFRNLEDVDAYSIKNQSETTYSLEMEDIDTWNCAYNSCQDGYFFIKLTCKRKKDDILRFLIYKDKERVCKLGQYPSLADIQLSEVDRKYKKVLDSKDFVNFKRAIGLAAHGIGAGSFVYLRRIFENLVFETYENNKEKISTEEDEFKKKRMLEKVEELKEYLPSQLLEMKNIYSILSNGVHELEEEDCLKYFSPIKFSIELILDQKIEEDNKKKKEKQVRDEIKKITAEIKKNSTKSVE